MTPLELVFWALLAALVVQRLAELRLASRNTRALLAAGGREHDERGYHAFVVLHALFIAGLVAEFTLAPWAGDVHPLLTGGLLLLFLGAQALRYWAIRTLGVRWTTRIVTIPGAAPVRDGPYRYVRHPNYLAVVVELLVIPLAFGLPVTAVVATAANAVLLARRIRLEEEALEKDGPYGDRFGATNRFLPRLGAP